MNNWRKYNGALIPTTPPHIEVDATNIEQKIQEEGSYFARWTSNFDQNEETEFWYVICDEKLEILDYSKNTRNQIRRGLRNCEVMIIDKKTVLKEGFESYKKAISLAKIHDTKVAISLSDPFIVSAFKEELKELIEIKCDIIFCNGDEASEFADSKDEEQILNFFRNYSPNLLITKGSEGCSGYDQDGLVNAPGLEVQAIDTNGAGDMFAGAVLNGLNQSKSLEESANFGCFAASKIVQNSGPRLTKNEYLEIKAII